MKLLHGKRIAGCVSVLLAGWVGVWACADLVAIGPRSLLSEAVGSRVDPSSRGWQSAYQALSAAADLKPQDANLQFELGRTAWMQAAHLGSVHEQRANWLELSIGHLRRATAYRPTWGRAWAELANAYLQHGDLLSARNALIRAMEQEPYEGQAQWMVMWTGFAIWPMLLQEDRDTFLTIAKHVLNSYDFQWAIDPAVLHGHEDVLRALIQDNTDAQAYLAKAVKRRTRLQAAHR